MTNGHQDEGREGEQHASIGRFGCLLSGKYRPEHHTARQGLDAGAVATLRYTSVVSVTSVVRTAIRLRWVMNAKNRTRRAYALPLAKLNARDGRMMHPERKSGRWRSENRRGQVASTSFRLGQFHRSSSLRCNRSQLQQGGRVETS